MSKTKAEEPAKSRPSETSSGPSDHSLLHRFRRGHPDASTQLYLRYARRLHALAVKQSSPDLAQRVDPEDIVQSVFRTFFRRAAQGHYDVPDGEEIWKLLLVIALNKVRAAGEYHRAAKRDVRITASGPSYERAVEKEAGQDETAYVILRMVVDQALEGLAPLQRRMIELRIEGHEVSEIARQVERSKRTVERILQEFRARLDTLIHGDQ